MRQFLIVSLLTALYGCSAPVPEASAPGVAATGKADGQCVFGNSLGDIVDSGRFYVDDPETLDAHTRFGSDEEAALLAGMPPGVRSLDAVFAWVDGGQVVRRYIESDENPGEDTYVLFTYEIGQEATGFLVSQGTTHVAAFLIDGLVEGCNTGISAPTGGGQCLFGGTVDDLMQGFFNGDFEYTDDEKLSIDSEFTAEQAAQLQAMIPVGGGGVEVLFAQTDDGEIEVGKLVSATTDHDAFTFYSYDQDGAQMGFIYVADSLERVAMLSEGVWTDCSVTTADAPSPTNGAMCLFGGTVNDLMEGFFSGDFEYTDDEKLTVDSELTAEQAGQLQAMIPVGGGGVEVLFAQTDDGEIEVGKLVSATTDHDAFTFYSYDRDGAQTGFIYVADSLERVAMLSDGVWTDCTVSP